MFLNLVAPGSPRASTRSALATDAMSKAGLTHVDNLGGGIGDLQAAGASIVG